MSSGDDPVAARVEEALAPLADLGAAPTHEHADAYEAVDQRLQAVLADLGTP